MDEIAVHLMIEGRVQGVGFRYYTKEKAQKFGLKGWVRNTFDEKVEAYAEGQRDQLDLWINHLQQGPRSAFVTEIKKEWMEPQGKFNNFQVIPSS